MRDSITLTTDHAAMARALFATPASMRRLADLTRGALTRARMELDRDGPGLNGWRVSRVARLEAELERMKP